MKIIKVFIVAYANLVTDFNGVLFYSNAMDERIKHATLQLFNSDGIPFKDESISFDSEVLDILLNQVAEYKTNHNIEITII